MPFAAPLHWPLTLFLATLTLMTTLMLIWWIQLPSLPTLSRPRQVSTPLWTW